MIKFGERKKGGVGDLGQGEKHLSTAMIKLSTFSFLYMRVWMGFTEYEILKEKQTNQTHWWPMDIFCSLAHSLILFSIKKKNLKKIGK